MIWLNLYNHHYELEWVRLAREAPPWPRVRADLARLMRGAR